MSKKSIIIFSICLIIIVSLIGCTNKKSEIKKVEIMKIVINDKEYDLNIEDTIEAQDFIKNVPEELVMQDLNSNEKYMYVDKVFMNNPINVNKINKGDLMLYGDNCIVLFYKSFDTTYSYTKIGHINNLEDFDKKDINVKFILN